MTNVMILPRQLLARDLALPRRGAAYRRAAGYGDNSRL